MIYKKNFVEMYADATGVTKKDASAIYDSVFEMLGALLENGEEVAIIPVGRFKVIDKPEKECFNPQTREKMVAPAHKIVKFVPAKSVKDAVRGL